MTSSAFYKTQPFYFFWQKHTVNVSLCLFSSAGCLLNIKRENSNKKMFQMGNIMTSDKVSRIKRETPVKTLKIKPLLMNKVLKKYSELYKTQKCT